LWSAAAASGDVHRSKEREQEGKHPCYVDYVKRRVSNSAKEHSIQKKNHKKDHAGLSAQPRLYSIQGALKSLGRMLRRMVRSRAGE
jgi:hypothetical protein